MYAGGTGQNTLSAEGSSDQGTDGATATTYQSGTSTQDQTGNQNTGAYTLHQVSTTNGTALAVSTQQSTVTGADSLTDGFQVTATTISSGTTTLDRTQTTTGAYTLHQTGTTSSTVFQGGSAQNTLAATGSGDTVTDAGTATTYQTGTSTITQIGNDTTGAYSLHEVDTTNSTGFVVSSDLNSLTVTSSGGYLDAAYASTTATTYATGTTTQDKSGNNTLGTYTLAQTGTNASTSYNTGTDQGLASGGTVTDYATSTSLETGSSQTGLYTLSLSGTDSATTISAGSDSRGTFTATATNTATSTTTGSGNRSLGTSTQTVIASTSGTATRAGGNTSASYDQTVASTDNSTATTTANSGTGLSTRIVADTNTSTLGESGSSATTDYTLTQVGTVTTAGTVTNNAQTGEQTSIQAQGSNSSLYENGWEGTADYYVLNKTTTGYLDTTQVGDAGTGDYTLTGTTGTNSTALETVTNGSYGEAYTEILTDSSSLTGYGNNSTGAYARTGIGARTDNFVDAGTDATGTYQVTEGSSGTYTRTTVGNTGTGATDMQEGSVTGYSLTQVVSGASNVTLVERGTDTDATTQTGDTTTGGYTALERGTDGYTLVESGTQTGGTFSQTVAGTDGYTATTTGSSAAGTSSGTTVGGGAWSRTASGAATLGTSSGTNGYTLTTSGNAMAGSFSQLESGTDRYGLVDQFDDVSNTGSGTTPGNLTFHSHGVAFQDPTPEEIAKLRKQRDTLLREQFPVMSPNVFKKANSNELAVIWNWWQGLNAQQKEQLAKELAEFAKAAQQKYAGQGTGGASLAEWDILADLRKRARVTVPKLTPELTDKFNNGFSKKYNDIIKELTGAVPGANGPDGTARKTDLPAGQALQQPVPGGAPGRPGSAAVPAILDAIDSPLQAGAAQGDKWAEAVNGVAGQLQRGLNRVTAAVDHAAETLKSGSKLPLPGSEATNATHNAVIDAGAAVVSQVLRDVIGVPAFVLKLTSGALSLSAANADIRATLLAGKPGEALKKSVAFVLGTLADSSPVKTAQEIERIHDALKSGQLPFIKGQDGWTIRPLPEETANGTSQSNLELTQRPLFAYHLNKFLLQWGNNLDPKNTKRGQEASTFVETVLTLAIGIAEARIAAGGRATAPQAALRSEVEGAPKGTGRPPGGAGERPTRPGTVAETVAEAEKLAAPNCFAAGIPLRTPDGAKPIEQFRPGDLILSRAESDPDGVVEPKVVEEVFCRFGKIIQMHVDKQVIGVTTEHPVWVQGKGWQPARELIPGDRLVGHDRQWSIVEKVVDDDQ